MYEITRSFHDEKQSESKLNFNNRESVEHQTLAEGNLITAKALYDDMQMKKYKKHKKRIGQNALKSAIESTEHSFKAVSCADEIKMLFFLERRKSERSMTIRIIQKYLQREQENAKINILEKKDVEKLNKTVKNKGADSPYNAVRYKLQGTTEEAVKECQLRLLKKAYDNVKKLKEKQSTETIELKGVSVTFPRILQSNYVYMVKVEKKSAGSFLFRLQILKKWFIKGI